MSDFVRRQLTVFDAELERLERESEGIRKARAALAYVLDPGAPPPQQKPATVAPKEPPPVAPAAPEKPVTPQPLEPLPPVKLEELAPATYDSVEKLLKWAKDRGKQQFNAAMVMKLLSCGKTRAYEVLGAAYRSGHLEPLGNGWYRKRDAPSLPTPDEDEKRLLPAGAAPGSGAQRGATERLLSVEEVRDVVVKEFANRSEWRIGALLPFFPDASRETVKRRLTELVERGIVVTTGVRAGMRYTYSPPPNNSPTTRPRGEQKVEGQNSERRATGEPVANTGLPMGRTGHPGRDQRLAQQGKNIRRH